MNYGHDKNEQYAQSIHEENLKLRDFVKFVLENIESVGNEIEDGDKEAACEYLAVLATTGRTLLKVRSDASVSQDPERFRYLTNDVASIPAGYSAPLDPTPTRELIRKRREADLADNARGALRGHRG